MCETVKEEIEQEIGDSWYTVKADGTRDPTGCENISIVVCFVTVNDEIRERLLTIATTDSFGAETFANTIVTEITEAGLCPSKILSQCYDGANVISGCHGGVQKILQDKLGREVPYIHCFNHQLHLVIVHAMSSEEKVEEFFNVCSSLYKFLRKPTAAVLYKGKKLKRLLEQLWTGHYCTVGVVVKLFNSIVDILSEIQSTRGHGTEVKIEAIGLLKQVSAVDFKFTAHIQKGFCLK
ncbi:zinc finger MYM-type protein 6-like [Huso huso]|uniref:Zinc finger MYM-type protein 6-like n=1 Tax=Huso huso TaxID=61971 RepID=A0ABR0ZW67_HUSHU